MNLFKPKNNVKLIELEKRVLDLERKLESFSNIRIGEFEYRSCWIDYRPKISISEVVILLIKHQGLELKHTSSSEKIELVKTIKSRA